MSLPLLVSAQYFLDTLDGDSDTEKSVRGSSESFGKSGLPPSVGRPLLVSAQDILDTLGVDSCTGKSAGGSSERAIKVNAIVDLVTRLFRSEKIISARSVSELVDEAYELGDSKFGVESAAAWAEGFRVPSHAVQEDLDLFLSHGGSIAATAADKLNRIKGSRLSLDRIESCISHDNPDKKRLVRLAEGMIVPLAPSFVPNGGTSPVKLRRLYMETKGAVDKMFYALRDEGLAIILPAEEVRRSGVVYHTSAAHWTAQKTKQSGRPLFDSKDAKDGTPLNSEEAKNMAEEVWGKIEHPTLLEIVTTVMDFWESAKRRNPAVLWSDVVLWKMDLRGAYTLLSFDPDKASLFGMNLLGGLIIFFLCGVFGWSCTPFAFQVVTRSVLFELRKILAGLVAMYVDDIFGVCLLADLQRELALTRALCVDLLGPNAVADKKTEYGRRLEIIGYTIDLDSGLVTIARKNFLKAFYVFFEADLEGRFSLRELQRFQSYGARYSTICRLLRPLNSAFNTMVTGKSNASASWELSQSCKTAILLWRAMMVLVAFDEKKFTRSLGSFLKSSPEIYIQTDASLFGVGVLVFKGSDRSCLLGGCAASISSFGFGKDSSFQNTSEFIGSVLGVIIAIQLGYVDSMRRLGIGLVGDSTTALSWLKEEKYRAGAVSNASVVFTLLAFELELAVSDTVWISGVDNWKADELSRVDRLDRSLNSVVESMGYVSSQFFRAEEVPALRRFLALMDPAIDVSSQDAFNEFWGRVADEVKNFAGVGKL